MIHLTLNTGHSAPSDPFYTAPKFIEMMADMVASGGGHLPGVTGWHFKVGRGNGNATFDLRYGPKDECIFAFNAVSWTREGAKELWDLLETQYLKNADALAASGALLSGVAEYSEMPESLPWLATWLLPEQMELIPNLADIQFMSGIEQAIAATLIHLHSS